MVIAEGCRRTLIAPRKSGKGKESVERLYDAVCSRVLRISGMSTWSVLGRMPYSEILLPSHCSCSSESELEVIIFQFQCYLLPREDGEMARVSFVIGHLIILVDAPKAWSRIIITND